MEKSKVGITIGLFPVQYFALHHMNIFKHNREGFEMLKKIQLFYLSYVNV